MLRYKHICLDGLLECDDSLLLRSNTVYDAIDVAIREFSKFFTDLTGFSLWAMQRAWARRMLAGESFALIAPTGVGKSTLLQTYGLYRGSGGERVLYVVPTRSLLHQAAERMRALGRKTGVEVVEGLSPECSGVCVATYMLLFKRRDVLNSLKFATVIVDDFDALLKKSSLLDSILTALGFTQEDIETAKKLTKLKQSAFAMRHSSSEQYKEVLESIEKLEAQLAEVVGNRRLGQLLIATATGRGKKERIKVLRELLSFEIGSIVDYLRNVREFSAPLERIKLADIVSALGRGTLVFVSREMGRDYVKRVAEELEKSGIKVGVAHTDRAIEKLRRGDVDALVGVATYYGVLTRGIDEPEIIKSSVFVGVPKFSVPLDVYLTRTSNIVLAYRSLVAAGQQDENLSRMYEILSRLPQYKLKVIDLCLRGILQPSSSYMEELVRYAGSLRGYVLEVLKRELAKSSRIALGNSLVRSSSSSEILVDIPDIYTYVQGSGRTSRLFNGRMTLGISILLYENEDIYGIFLKKLRNIFESSFRALSKEELSESLEEAVRSRSSSGGQSDVLSRIVPTLIVVESPTKARTIAKMFGGGGKRFIGGITVYETVIPVGQIYYVATIVPSLGHVFDLSVDTGVYGVRVSKDGAVEPVYTTLKRCRECGYQYTDDTRVCPRCGSLRVYDSMRVINVLRKLAKESSLVVIATDADEEGEKIAYDVYVSVKPYNSNIRRAEFHEITRYGVISGLSSLRDVDLSLVRSQVVRRVDDRFVGFSVSSILKEFLGTPNAGGGRVQTPVLSWVVERYEEYRRGRGYIVSLSLPYGDLALKLYAESREEAEKLSSEVSSQGIEVVPLAEEVEVVSPKPPYTTDTALEELGRQLKLAPGETMRVLQELYELGFITYHRTASTRVSSHGIEIARAYLRANGLEGLFNPRSWGEGGAHEAIRPTRPVDDIEAECLQMGIPLTRKHYEAYRIIFRRFLASQMSPSSVAFTWYSFRLLGRELARLKLPTRIVSEGFGKVLPIKTYELPREVTRVVPSSVKVYRGSKVNLLTTSEVIRRMREEGIGRPSTYAKALENNRRHGYLVISKYRQFLVPTKRGITVLELVNKVCPNLATPLYTAKLMRMVEKVDRDIPYDLALLLPISTLAEISISDLIHKNRSLHDLESSLIAAQGADNYNDANP